MTWRLRIAWRKEMEKKMKACLPVMERTSAARFDWTAGLVIFRTRISSCRASAPNRSVASDSIRASE